MDNIKDLIFTNTEMFAANANRTDLLHRIRRRITISDQKCFYSESEMVPKLCTKEEYRNIKTSDYYKRHMVELQETATLMSKSVLY